MTLGSGLPSSMREQLASSAKLVEQNLARDNQFVDIYGLSKYQRDDSHEEVKYQIFKLKLMMMK